MASKYVKIGSVIKSIRKDGSENFSIGLGSKGKNPQYNLSVELVVRDSNGKVVARQTDGFINLNNPRTEPDELLQRGIITEEKAHEMKQNLNKLPDKIKFVLKVPTVSS